MIIGCGDLGRRLNRHLASSTIDVTGLRRHPPEPADMQYVAADATDASAMSEVLKAGFDTIVLTLTPAGRSDEGYRQGYVVPCQVLLKALESAPHPPRRILFVSSTAVYGQSEGEWVSEDSPTEPARYNGERVLEAEQVLRDSAYPVTVLRLAGVYGPGRSRLLEKVRAGRAGPKPSWSNRIHSEDAAGFMAYVLTELPDPADTYLVADDRPTPYAEVVAWLARETGASLAPPEQPANLNKRIDNRRLRESGYQLRYPDFKAGFNELI